MDLSGNSFGNKGWFVILTFRKYRGKYTHTRQKALIAGREISVGRPTDLGRHTAESAWIALARRAWAHAVGWAAAAHHGGWRWSSSPALANGCARQVRAAQSLNLHGHTDSMCDRERQTVACFRTGHIKMSAMSTELEQLKDLWSQGLLNASEFARMAAELKSGAGPSGASTSDAPQTEPAEEEEMLVDESGEQYHSQEASTAPRSHASADAFSDKGSFGSGSPLRSCHSSPQSPTATATSPGQPATPCAEASPPQTGPQHWESGKLVNYTADDGTCKEVIFLRMGNEADWINNGRCKIQWKTVKPGKQRVYDIHTKWVSPEKLARSARRG